MPRNLEKVAAVVARIIKMQLRAISYQWGKGRENEDFSAVYKSVFAGEGADWFQKTVSHTVNLLEYLEKEISGPDQWICTSHSDCVFYPSDSEHWARDKIISSQPSSLSVNCFGESRVDVIIDCESSNLRATLHSGDMKSTAKLIGDLTWRN